MGWDDNSHDYDEIAMKFYEEEMSHETKHTPAPWMIEDSGDHINIHNEKFDIATIYNVSNDYNCYAIERKANARLISAAPELLEALEEILEHDYPPEKLWSGDAACSTYENPRLIKARSALAKARRE